jgi:nitrogen regulatory protein P-II 1
LVLISPNKGKRRTVKIGEYKKEMKRVEAIVRVERLRRIRERLKELDVGGIILHADGWTKDGKLQLMYRGLPVSYDLIPLAKFELFIPDDKLELVVKTIKENARTGEAGDGVIV